MGQGQVSNGLLMTPMTTASATTVPMTAISMGYSNAGGASRSSVSHSGPQSKLGNFLCDFNYPFQCINT